MATEQVQTRPGAPAAVFTGSMVGLLGLAVFINYLDRGNLATAAPLIKDELKLSNTQIGVLVSAFFWVYAPAQIFAAYVIQRLNAYRALAIGVALWSLATFLTGFVGSFAVLLGLRALLGLGESAAYPASSKLFAQHLPRESLGFANSMISLGQLLGPAVGTLAGGLLVAHAGWRMLFIIFGAASLLWLVPWLLVTRTISARVRHEAYLPEPSYAQLLSKPQLWGASLGHFCSNYGFYMVISWLPIYLVKVHGFSLTAMGELGGASYVLGAACAVSGGWLADRWIRRGMPPSRARIGMMVTSNLCVVVCMLACGLGDARLAIAGLIGSQAANGIGGFNLFAIGQSLAGPRAAAKWIGVQNAVGNMSGVVAPVVTGWIIDRTGHFSLAFLVAGALAGLGALTWRFVVRDVTPLTWRPG